MAPWRQPVTNADQLDPGYRIHCSCLVLQYDSTLLLAPGWIATVDPFGNLLCEKEALMPEAPTPSMVYDVIEACADPGCPLCRVSLRWGGRFMAAILYEEVTDPHARGRLQAVLWLLP